MMRNIKTEDSVVGAHFRILKILKVNGPLTYAELQKELKWPPTTLKDRLKRLCYLHEIKKLEDSGDRYALSDYVEYEDLIKKELRAYGVTENQPISRKHMKAVAIEISVNYKDKQFTKAFNKVMKEWKLSWL